MKWACVPYGVGKPPGVRAIEDDWPMVGDEIFTSTFWSAEMVLAEDEKSLRPATALELSEIAKIPPLREQLEFKGQKFDPLPEPSVEEKLKRLGLTPQDLKDAIVKP